MAVAALEFDLFDGDELVEQQSEPILHRLLQPRKLQQTRVQIPRQTLLNELPNGRLILPTHPPKKHNLNIPHNLLQRITQHDTHIDLILNLNFDSELLVDFSDNDELSGEDAGETDSGWVELYYSEEFVGVGEVAEGVEGGAAGFGGGFGGGGFVLLVVHEEDY